MAQFTVNPRRFDPYKDFRFRVKWVFLKLSCNGLRRV